MILPKELFAHVAGVGPGTPGFVAGTSDGDDVSFAVGGGVGKGGLFGVEVEGEGVGEVLGRGEDVALFGKNSGGVDFFSGFGVRVFECLSSGLHEFLFL